MKKRLLLHTCCAPCSAYVLELLKHYDVSVFYYNPNIDTKEEYDRRRNECQNYCEKNGIGFIEEKYEPEAWDDFIKGLESEPEGGARCTKCFEMRLTKTAEFAKKYFENPNNLKDPKDLNNRISFATTLSISPHKNTSVINAVGKDLSKKLSIDFIEENWKKEDGYKKSCEISRTEGFYRQNYCGCKYSKHRVES